MGKLDKVEIELKKLDPPGNFAWLAKKIGINQSQLSRYNNGGISLPYHWKIKIANMFKGKMVADLFDD